MSTHFIEAVWGDSYRESFLRFCVPSLLSPRNFPLLTGRDDCRLRIFTDREGERVLAEHPAIRRMKECLAVELVYAPATEVAADSSLQRLAQCHNQAIRQGRAERATLVFLSPDQVFADGLVQRLVDHQQAGKRLVLMIGTLRAEKNPFLQEIGQQVLGPDDTIQLMPRELLRIAFRHLHPLTVSAIADSGLFRKYPFTRLWWSDPDTLVGRAFFLHPILVDVSEIDVAVEVAIDWDWCGRIWDRFRAEEIHCVEDSDEMTFVEFSRPDHNAHNVGCEPSFSLSPEHWPIEMLGKPNLEMARRGFVLHTGNLDRTALEAMRWPAEEYVDHVARMHPGLRPFPAVPAALPAPPPGARSRVRKAVKRLVKPALARLAALMQGL
jgi:hypothetical protein